MPKSVLPRARARAPQLPGRERGQRTGAGEYDFRDVLCLPHARAPQRQSTGARFSRLKMPKSVLPRAAPPPEPQRGQSTGAG